MISSYVSSLFETTPDVEYIQQVKVAEPSLVLTAGGTELTSFRRVQQEWVSLDRISPHVVNALIATEDHRFYEHDGVDIGRTLAAFYYTLRGDMQGGSTITQQLARNVFHEDIGRARNVTRKLKEIVTAVKIEREYTKQQILETYFNTVPFLYNAFGIEMAARTYFSKAALDLDVAESATLVGMLKGTHYYNPVLQPERAKDRRNTVLGQMLKHGYLQEEEYASLRLQDLQLSFKRQIDQSGPSTHFTEHVRKWLVNWAERNDYDLYSDGLLIQTTLDDTLQKTAEEAVARQAKALQHIADVEWSRKSSGLISHTPAAYSKMREKAEPFAYFWNTRADLLDAFIRESAEFRKAVAGGSSDAAALSKLRNNAKFMAHLRENKTRLEAGFVAIDPVSREVKAWVGSRDFTRDQFDHVAQAERQPGSTFKPIVYAAALEQGFSPTRSYRDQLVTIRYADGEVWKPTDMGGATGRAMPMREGLIHSKNSITAQVMQDVGLTDIVSLAQGMGINQSKLKAVPSLALGTSPVTLLEMVSAYATIAQTGEFQSPVIVKRISDRHGNVVAEFGGDAKRAMSETTAIELIDMMRGAVTQGTGQAIRAQFGINADIAGKTGTTQNNTDGWFIMMHPNLVAGSWVGFNDARVTMRSDHWGQGGHNALLVVGDFFRGALKEKLIDAKAKFPRPKRAPLMVQRPADELDSAALNASPASELIVQRQPDGTIFIGDAAGAQTQGWAERSTKKTPEEMARIMRSLGRDPATGARISERRTAEAPPQRRRATMSGESNPLQNDASSDLIPQSFR